MLSGMAKKSKPFKDSLGKRDTVKNMITMKMTLSQICLALGCSRQDLDEYYGDLIEKYHPLEHVPTEEDRQFVWRCAAICVSQEEIAKKLGIDSATLREYYRTELDSAKIEWMDNLHRAMYQSAVNGNFQANQFLLKTKGGFKETQVNEHTGPDGQPLAASINITVGKES